jgi:hypothetical protein
MTVFIASSRSYFVPVAMYIPFLFHRKTALRILWLRKQSPELTKVRGLIVTLSGGDRADRNESVRSAGNHRP